MSTTTSEMIANVPAVWIALPLAGVLLVGLELDAEEAFEEPVEEPVQPEAVQEEEQPQWTATERVITEPEQQPERQLQPEESADLDNTLTKTR